MTGVTTAALAAVMLYAAHSPVAAKAVRKAMRKPTAMSAVVQGKALVTKYRCNGCHGPTLTGRHGFSPSLHLSGAMHDYTQPQFAKLLETGMKNDGGHVRPPMPVYNKAPRPGKITTAQANSIYAYLHTLK